MDIENVNGKANAGVTLGTIGTALSGLQLLGSHAGNLFSCGNGAGGIANAAATMMCGESAPVTRYELGMSQRLAEKDAKIQRLELSQETDKKVLELYEYISGRVRDVENKIAEQNAAQREWNATATGSMSAMSNQIQTMRGVCHQITKVVVPNTAICPGWGEITVTPVAPTTAAAATTPVV